VLTLALSNAGDPAAAEEVCAAGLAQSRDAGDVQNQEFLLPYMVMLEVHAGRVGDAAAHLREGLEVTVRAGGRSDLLTCLDGCGHVCVATGRPAEAITVWAAFAALLAQDGAADIPAWVRRRTGPLLAARQALGAGRTRAAEERGAAMSLATAAEYALMLTAADPQQTQAPGAGELSPRERELLTLVARGRTNAQIAAQLYISIRTVSSHLDRIRDKTGCRRRADLTRLALTEGLA